MFDSLHTKGCRDMGFASPRAADQHDVLGSQALARFKLQKMSHSPRCEIGARNIKCSRQRDQGVDIRNNREAIYQPGIPLRVYPRSVCV
ncbi:hypothetical protein GGR95_003411 [Sulfitobacter undariae]|uniref:Uncharacterized protein n=1 Tax=Sulfitobacter undariae TaxID=1563671 RepID=A0A7W6H242_9RHOB|nr:hypothetical protein [Sulfitobacter undariae]